MICHIKTILAVLDMSQQDFAAELSISRNTVTDWVRKGTAPKLDLAYNVVDFLNARAERIGIDKRWTERDVWEK